MSSPLQRAEELKSLISQYQAELSDIYSIIHSSKTNQKPQIICLMTNAYLSDNTNIKREMDNNVKPTTNYDMIMTQYNYQGKTYNDAAYAPKTYRIMHYPYNPIGWGLYDIYNEGSASKSDTNGYYAKRKFYPVIFV